MSKEKDALKEIKSLMLKNEKSVDRQEVLRIIELMDSSASKDDQDLTDLIHSILCYHPADADCDYYEEETYTDCWVRKAHKQWLGLTNKLMFETGFKVLNEKIKATKNLIKTFASIEDGEERMTLLLYKSLIIYYNLRKEKT